MMFRTARAFRLFGLSIAAFAPTFAWSAQGAGERSDGLMAELDLSGDGAEFSYVAEISGALSVWAISEHVDLRLAISASNSPVIRIDEDGGGGTTPWLSIDVEPGVKLEILVALQEGDGAPFETQQSVALHIVTAPETEETRALAAAVQFEFEGAPEQNSPGSRDAESMAAAREAASFAIEEILATPGSETSERLLAALSVASTVALECRALESALLGWEAADERSRRWLPPTHRRVIRAMGNLAIARHELGDVAGAAELEEEVLRIALRTRGPEHPDVLTAAHNLAATRRALGDLAGAMELFEFEIEKREALGTEPTYDSIAAKHNLAILRSDLRDYEGARRLQISVLDDWEAILGSENLDVVAARHNLATTLMALGDLEIAREALEEVVDVRTRLLAPEDPETQFAKASLAIVLAALGEVDEAEALLQEARDTVATRIDPVRASVLDENLAVIRAIQGDDDGALELLERVQKTIAPILPLESNQRTSVIISRANVARSAGDLELSRALLELVLTSTSALASPDGSRQLQVEMELAATLLELGELPSKSEVTHACVNSLVARAEWIRLEAPRSARAMSARYIASFGDFLRFVDATYPAASAEHARWTGRLFAALEGLRSAATRSARFARLGARDPEMTRIRTELTRVGSALAQLAFVRPSSHDEVEQWRAEIVRLTEERDRLESALAGRIRREELPPITLETLASGLGEDAALVAFLRCPSALRTPGEEDRLLAFVLTQRAELQRLDLGSAAYVSDLVGRWRDAILASDGTRGIGASEETSMDEAGWALRDAVFEPCLAVLPELPRTLHIVPDDALHLVPLDALPDEDGALLGDVIDLRLEDSGFHHVEPIQPSSTTGGLVVIGGVDFDAAVSGPDWPSIPAPTPPLCASRDEVGRSVEWEPLLYSRLEVELIGMLATDAVSEEPRVVTGAAAHKGALLELAPNARWLHLATHGWFAPEAAVSALDAAQPLVGRRDEASLRDSLVEGFAPMTLCGLVLAGANRGYDQLGRVPGIVTAEEIAALDLTNCELAVLSACRTNVGLRRAGQGIHSLRTALHAAGAATTITSLWQVDDAASRRLFEIFYRGLWERRLGKSEALARAKRTLRSEGYRARDWSGWVLSGDAD